MSDRTTQKTEKAFTAEDRAFLDGFYEVAGIGATGNGGVERQAASEADGQQRRWLADLLREHGFAVHYDRIGNEFGLLELIPDAPYVLVGSHLDSQPTAGRYDGAYGVLAGAYAALRLAAKWRESNHTPRYNIGVVNWFNEEGSRFKPSMMGSGVFTGKLDLAKTLDTTDAAGITVRDALDAIGCRDEYDARPTASYAEIHIEQGRGMEKEGVTIGLVHSNWAANKYEFIVNGQQAHTGSTVIVDRKDALLGASMLVVATREIADHFQDGVLHTSVGQLTVYPNSPVVVPSRVDMLLDLRSADEDVLAEADQMLQERIAHIQVSANVEIERGGSHCWSVTPYQPEGVALAASVATELGLSSKPVMTLAGHDSTNMKDIVPTVMLFVQSVDGISHNELEFTHDEDIVAGVTMLTAVVEKLAEGALT